MAITWNISSTSGLANNYKETVKRLANNHGYGSLYEATRLSDSGNQHRWRCKTKKYLGISKYQFICYTNNQQPLHEDEQPAGYGPDVTKL
ncbi:hypothetical protein ACQRCQ_12320 [Lachnospiraceae bacterium SGI.085]